MSIDPTISASAAAIVGAIAGTLCTLGLQNWNRRHRISHETAQLARQALTEATHVLDESVDHHGWVIPDWHLAEGRTTTPGQIANRLRQTQARITNRRFRTEI